MKKMLGSLLLSGTLLLGAVLPMVAHADATENRSGSTSVTATFTGSTSTVNPVDPTDPNKNLDPEPGTDTNGGKAGGGLSLIYVPANLSFGSNEIDVQNDKNYALDTTDTTATNLLNNNVVVEVSDVRGTNAGWSLTVSGSALTGADNKTAAGASITLPAGNVTASGATSNNGATATAATVNLDGSSTNVMGAAVDNGAGVTVNQMDPTGVKLNVSANTVSAQAYKSTLTWNLSDTPTK
ncbi:WxL domain-containing protein [Lactiplantibacillus daowaiensis]|uniref:WxL domain-containing protein n=1 Tax=Lactiplantibacillus daowaiensis TaxID=2559918 RepID=A0ABW1S3E9_9LACO|nr:WxL domain-containing protein [Lactiplantibacillus daowaiensis]